MAGPWVGIYVRRWWSLVRTLGVTPTGRGFVVKGTVVLGPHTPRSAMDMDS